MKMSPVIEEILKEYGEDVRKDASLDHARRLLSTSLTDDEIASTRDLTVDEVRRLRKESEAMR